MPALEADAPAAAAPPRYEADPVLVMDVQAIYAREAARRNQPQARANAQEKWREAYFEALRRGLIDPYACPGDAKDGLHG